MLNDAGGIVQTEGKFLVWRTTDNADKSINQYLTLVLQSKR